MTTTADEKRLEFQCDFSKSATIGGDSEDRSSIGVSISRNRLSPTVAAKTFCGTRVGVKIRVAAQGGEDVAQTHAPADGHPEVVGHSDVGGFRCGPDSISFRLKFENEEIDKNDLANFGGRSGSLIVTSVEDIPEPTPEERADAKSHRNGAPAVNTTGKDEGVTQPISALVDFGFPARLVSNVIDACSGDTIGHLEIRQRIKPSTWMKDIQGCGGKSQELLVEAYEGFRRKFPMPEKTLFEQPQEQPAS